MANIKSAKKRIRVIEKKTARNSRIKNHVKEAEKAFLAEIKAGNVAGAEKAFKAVEKKLMQAAAKGTFHKNTVSRTIGRFENKLNAIKSGKTVKIDEPAKKKAKKKAEPVVEAQVEETPVVEETAKVEKPEVNASMKKDELLEVAKKLGVEVPAKATKADILAAIEAK